jgi:hypothetical protein
VNVHQREVWSQSVRVSVTSNKGPVPEAWYAGSLPARPQFYAHDPDNDTVGTIPLGEHYTTDPFTNYHEEAASKALGEAHEAIESCSGPAVTTVRKWLRTKIIVTCGAGFKNEAKFIRYLNGKASDSLPRTIIPTRKRDDAE